MKKLSILLVIATFLLCQAATAQPAGLKAMNARLRAQIDRRSDSALSTADSLLTLAIALKDSDAHISALTLKGKSLFQQKKPKEALETYFTALKLCKSPANDRRIAYLYGEIGYVLFSQQHLAESIHYYKEEVAIRKRISGADSVGDQLINLSVMYQGQKLFDSAETYLEEVAGILARTNNVKLSGYYHFNKGALLERKGKLDSATTYYLHAYNDWKSIGHESQLFKVVFNLGFLEFEKKNYAKAIEYYKQSEAAARKFGMMSEIAHVYGTKAEAYAELKDYKNAYDALYSYATMTDSLSRADLNNYIAKLDKQFQSEKAKQTIQEQQLQLQKQKSNMLLIILLLVVVVFAAIVLFVYFSFKNRVQKKVEEAKEKFFANVAHEVRTPLSMIQGPIKVLQEQLTTSEAKYQLDMAERNTIRLNQLINQMLDLSKMDAERYQLSESMGNAGEFIKEIAGQYAHTAKEKGLTYSIELDETGNSLFDKDALEKIVGNLLGNAIKYTPAGGSAGISAAIIDNEMRITVWDTGCGIAPADQERIFDRFFRATQGGAKAKGIGIGLSLTKELVALMQGSISIVSEQGRGAAFTVRLPVKVKEQFATGGSVGNGETILLVEDDADILDFNQKLLASQGYSVITATNGNEAIAALQVQLPDLVITDVMMPGKTGIELLAEIRSNEAANHIPVVMLSAKSSTEARVTGLETGAQAYLPKPFQPAELIAVVKNQLSVLERQRQAFRAVAEDSTHTTEDRFAASDPFVQKCTDLILAHLDDAGLTVERLAELVNTNRSHFQRKLKTLTGFSPSELIRTIRLEKAMELLQKKEGNITEVAYLTGFTSQSYFTKCFSDHFGYPPSQISRKDEATIKAGA